MKDHLSSMEPIPEKPKAGKRGDCLSSGTGAPKCLLRCLNCSEELKGHAGRLEMRQFVDVKKEETGVG